MKKIILCFFYSLLFCQLIPAQKSKQLRYVPPLSTDSSFSKGSFECEVLQLTNQNRSTGIMIVLVEKGEEKMHRNQLRSNYLFKRERMYLRTVFFAEVEVLERINVVTDVSALLQRLKKDYYQPQLWSVLRTDAFFSTVPQRSGNLYALHR